MENPDRIKIIALIFFIKGNELRIFDNNKSFEKYTVIVKKNKIEPTPNP